MCSKYCACYSIWDKMSDMKLQRWRLTLLYIRCHSNLPYLCKRTKALFSELECVKVHSTPTCPLAALFAHSCTPFIELLNLARGFEYYVTTSTAHTWGLSMP